MSEGRADFEMLRAFVRQGDQQAFAAVARRHLDLVYATPLGWKWNAARAAQTEAAAVELRSSSARAQTEALSVEVARLRSGAARCDIALADAVQSRALNAVSAGKLERLKARIRGLLTDTDSRWPEDLPFVRVPKAALASMEVSLPVTPPGIIKPAACDMLGLTPEERQRIEGALAGYFSRVEERIQASLYETNRPTRGRIPEDALASKVFIVPALGKEITEAAERMMSEMQSVLGEERWGLVKPAFEMHGTRSLREIMNLEGVEHPQEVVVRIRQKGNTAPTVDYSWSAKSSSWSQGGIPLSQFLPEGEHDSTEVQALRASLLPTALLDRITTWLSEVAVNRLPKVPNL